MKAFVNIIKQLSKSSTDIFLEHMQTSMKAVSALDFSKVLAPETDLVEADATPLLSSPLAAKLHDSVPPLRAAHKELTMLMTFIAEKALPIIDNYNIDDARPLREHHELQSARQTAAERNSGLAIGRALGNLSALQILFACGDNKAQLAARLTVLLTNAPPNPPVAKMTADSKLIDALRAATTP